MKIISVTALAIPEVKVIRYGRFRDHRGYFTEIFRDSDFHTHPELHFLKEVRFVQANESHSRRGTLRGLHFQWDPYMGKLVRPLVGHLLDLVLDIRRGSPHQGKIIAYDMPVQGEADYGEWIWVPPGFAHGTCFPLSGPAESTIEYFCTGRYNPTTEASISPLASDLDWSLCDPANKARFDEVCQKGALISDKDRDGLSATEWQADRRSGLFRYGTAMNA